MSKIPTNIQTSLIFTFGNFAEIERAEGEITE